MQWLRGIGRNGRVGGWERPATVENGQMEPGQTETLHTDQGLRQHLRSSELRVLQAKGQLPFAQINTHEQLKQVNTEKEEEPAPEV